MTQNAKGYMVPYDYAKELQYKGYATDTPEQIVEATKSQSFYVRSCALKLLTERIEKKAIPLLKQSLNDPRFEVRFDAAHLLGTLGDKSGLEQMRQDLKEFAPDNGAPVPPDPNVVDPNQIKERESKRNLRLCYGLRASRVLAELGDRRGYELARSRGLDGTWPLLRQEAIYVLLEIAKTDPTILATENMDPASVLYVMAESEKNQAVFSSLISLVQKLHYNISLYVLERAVNSHHQSEKMRNVAKCILDKVKAQKNASETMGKDPS
jgi:HEAT repeat protein